MFHIIWAILEKEKSGGCFGKSYQFIV